MKGIYAYWDNKLSQYVYIGKDSHIDKNQRHKQHLKPSLYDAQQINRVLQNNPHRYEYSVIWSTEDCTTLKLNKMEILFGKIYNPKFNFDKFGKGGSIRHTEETKKKISESLKDKRRYISDEHKMKISKSMNTTGYFRVSKKKDKKCKQGFRWKYEYMENGKTKSITRVSFEKLKEKVLEKGLEWKKLKGDINDE